MWKPSSYWVVILLSLGGGLCELRAEDNVLGLPAARDPARPGSVMLHGGGRFTSEAFDRFIELAGGSEARIVLVPSAGYCRSEYSNQEQFAAALNNRFGSWLKLASNGRVRSVEFVATDNPADAEDEGFVRPLTQATGVWFGGGAQSRLNYRYVGQHPKQTRFQTVLREVVRRGGIVGGTSAGMAALPEIMAMSQSRPRPNGPVNVVAAHGLGLFDGAIVEQHFDGRSGRLERFTGLLRDPDTLDRLTGRPGASQRMLGLAVDGSTALVLRSDRLEALGEGHAHVFIKSPDQRTIGWHTLKSGDTIALKQSAPGQMILATRP